MIAPLLLLLLLAIALAWRRRALGPPLPPPLAATAVPRPRRRATTVPGVTNARDVAAAAPGLVRAGAVLRCASPLALAPRAAAAALAALGVGTLIDLRSTTEFRDAGAATAAALGVRVRSLTSESVAAKGGGNSAPHPLATVHHVPLQEWGRYAHAFVARLPLRRAAPIALAFAAARLARAKPPVPRLRRLLLAEINAAGLPAMYVTILAAFGGEAVAALRLVAAEAAARRPVAVACKLGKDRTGLIVALLLTVVGAPRSAVLADYGASGAAPAAALPGVPALSASPPAALAAALAWVEAAHGSVEAYLERHGFGAGEQAALRAALAPP
jgi:hypothetical protein